MACLQQLQELVTPRPVYKEAQVYYNDFNAEKRSKKFTQKTHEFNFICKATDSSIPITRKEQDLLADISNIIKASSRGLAYLSHTELSNLTGNNKRQNNIMRKNLSHILRSKWKKKIKIDGVVRSKVIIFKHTTDGEVILNNPKEYYKSIKAGTGLPISIYKDEKNIIKDRSSVQAHESSFCENSKSKKIEENPTLELPKFPKTLLKNKKCLPNQRKKSTNQKRKAKIYSPKFKQYDKPKNLSEHYPLTTEECSELQSRSGREFTLNAMNEILLDMSRKPNESKHKFPSKAAFMAYMSKVYRYEGRDAVKTANTGFKIVARATEAEIIQHTTQTERESYLNLIEQQAITHRSDENQLKAKWANTLPTNAAYNLLSNMRTVQKVGKMLQVLMDKEIELTEYSREIILAQANAVGVFMLVERLEVLVK